MTPLTRGGAEETCEHARMAFDWPAALELGPVSVLTGAGKGTYPDGNSVLVRGRTRSLLIDPSLSVFEAGEPPLPVDDVLLTHVHEDHVAGLARFPDTPVHAHEADVRGLHGIDDMLKIYGLPEDAEKLFRKVLEERFHVVPRPDARSFSDGARFELGGVGVEVIHAPGHTRGHCIFAIPEASAVVLGDIDLSGFGPYYGDAWSDLRDFEATLERCRKLPGEHFITFHHKGVISGRAAFLEHLEAFAAVIGRREAALLDFLREPRTLAEIVAHRFVYRPHVTNPLVSHVERRSAQLHLARLHEEGRIRELEPGRWRA